MIGETVLLVFVLGALITIPCALAVWMAGRDRPRPPVGCGLCDHVEMGCPVLRQRCPERSEP